MEKDFEKLTLNAEKAESANSQFFDDSKDFVEVELKNSARSVNSWEGTNDKVSIWLPTLDKFCAFVARDAACRLDRNLLEKYYDITTKTLTLPSTPGIFFENFILEILGALNEVNTFDGKLADFNFVDQEKVFKIEKENYFLNYLLRNIEVLQEKLKPNDTPKIKGLLEQMGIFIEKNIFDVIEKKILNERKILIALAAGDNLWIKSECSALCAGNLTYNAKINNYNFIFINKPFVEKFFLRIGQHPRCCVALVSSMMKKNLDKIVTTMKSEDYSSSINFEIGYVFDQEANEAYENADAKGGRGFRRSLAKISERTKNLFDATNTLFIESEADKAENIKNNMLYLKCFSEEIIAKGEEERSKIDKYAEQLLDYLEKLLNECDGDVREYLTRNPFKKI